MALGVTNQNPIAGAVGAYAPQGFSFDLTENAGNGITNSSIVIQVNSRTIYSLETFTDDWNRSTRTAITNGFRFLLRPKKDYAGVASTSEATVELTVDAQNGAGVPMVTSSWAFRIIDRRPPYLIDLVPTAFDWVAASPIAISFTILDGSASVGAVTIENIAVDGVTIYNGTTFLAPFDDPGSVLTPTSDGVAVNIVVPPGQFAAGRHYLDVQSVDDEVGIINRTNIITWFGVGDVTPPLFTNFMPEPGSTGNLVDTGVEFDISDVADINVGTLIIRIDEILVFDGAGAGFQPGYVGTTDPLPLPAVGIAVVINPDVDFANNTWHHVFIDVQDNNTNRSQHVFHFHTGSQVRVLIYNSTDPDEDLNQRMLQNSVVAVAPFDFSNSAFGNPTDRGLTGFGFDGVSYTDGKPAFSANLLATWRTEPDSAIRGSQDNFPLTGLAALTAQGWSIQEAFASQRMWMLCNRLIAPLATNEHWNMALSNFRNLSNIYVGEEPLIALFGESILLVNFIQDRAIRYNSNGRAVSALTIDQRESDQIGISAFDGTYAIADSASNYVQGWAELVIRKHLGVNSQSELIVAARPSSLEAVARISKEDTDFLLSEGYIIETAKTAPEEGGRGLLAHHDLGSIVAKNVLATAKAFPTVSTIPVLIVVTNGALDEVWLLNLWTLFTFDNILTIPTRFVFSTTSAPAIVGGPYIDAHITSFIEGGSSKFILTLTTENEVEVIDLNLASPGLSTITTTTLAGLALGAPITKLLSAATESSTIRSLYMVATDDAGTNERTIRRTQGVNTILTTTQSPGVVKQIRILGEGK